MSRPTSILVVGQRLSIQYVDGLDSAYGRCDLKAQRIAISEGQASDQERDTVLHEALHACFQIAAIQVGSSEEEEAICSALSPVLLDMLRRSPALASWLLEGGEHPL